MPSSEVPSPLAGEGCDIGFQHCEIAGEGCLELNGIRYRVRLKGCLFHLLRRARGPPCRSFLQGTRRQRSRASARRHPVLQRGVVNQIELADFGGAVPTQAYWQGIFREYNAEQFGLSEAAIHERFADYMARHALFDL